MGFQWFSQQNPFPRAKIAGFHVKLQVTFGTVDGRNPAPVDM